LEEEVKPSLEELAPPPSKDELFGKKQFAVILCLRLTLLYN